MNEAEVETEIKAKGLTAPRITPEHVDAQVVATQYHVFDGTTTTVCLLTLRNGFTVVGHSACASTANFDRELGEKIAFKNARDQIWALEGYALRTALSQRVSGEANSSN